eukprot:CAMPEP_0170785186 /NCGR_PEP_ID=MMETSP0733-20121128/16727_1 /TAXON_ID=186038 /ORGANISM="Fragilariopsis kerguelensis, Strain L26-C5" /LENGTH=175 /DNA_ID=CAMNT_0011130533 /DNA_START=164 /DNA_END=691 /DNA_ORIENTATION=+
MLTTQSNRSNNLVVEAFVPQKCTEGASIVSRSTVSFTSSSLSTTSSLLSAVSSSSFSSSSSSSATKAKSTTQTPATTTTTIPSQHPDDLKKHVFVINPSLHVPDVDDDDISSSIATTTTAPLPSSVVSKRSHPEKKKKQKKELWHTDSLESKLIVAAVCSYHLLKLMIDVIHLSV